MVKNLSVCLLGAIQNLYDFETARIGIFQKKCFQSIVGLGGFVLYFTSLLNKMQHIGTYFHFVENAEVLMLKSSCIRGEYNLS